MSEDWTAIKKKQIDKIKELEPKDRLDILEAMARMDQYISSSCQGWAQWIFNPTVINKFNEEELKDFYNRFRKITLDFLEFDAEVTQKLKSTVKKERRERTPPYA